MITPIGNFPAGYECESAVRVERLVPDIDTLTIVTSVWLVPGGAKVYCHSSVSEEALLTEAYWQHVADRVQQHVRSRELRMVSYSKGVSIFNGMALSDRPPPTQEYSDVRPHQTINVHLSPTPAGEAAGHDLNPF